MKHYLMICMLALSQYACGMDVEKENEEVDTILAKQAKEAAAGSVEDVQKKLELLRDFVNGRMQHYDQCITIDEQVTPYKGDNEAGIRIAQYKNGIEDIRVKRNILSNNAVTEHVEMVNGKIVLRTQDGYMLNPIGKLLLIGSTLSNEEGKILAGIGQERLMPFLKFFVEHKIGTEAIDGCVMSPAKCLLYAMLNQRDKFVRYLTENGFKQYAHEIVNDPELTINQQTEELILVNSHILGKLYNENADQARKQNTEKAIRRLSIIRNCLTAPDKKNTEMQS